MTTTGWVASLSRCAERLTMRSLMFSIVVSAGLIVGACATTSVEPIKPLAVIQSEDEAAKIPSFRHGEIEVVVIDVTPEDSGDRYFGGPLLSLRLSSGGKLIAEHRFQSSYGIFRLDAIDLDSNGEPEYVLVSGWGKGTSVREEWLEVLVVHEGVLRQILSTPYSGFFGSGASWRYRHEYRGIGGDRQVELMLHREHTPLGKGMSEHPNLIPAIGVKGFRFQPIRTRTHAQPSDAPNDGPATSVGNSDASGGGHHR